MKSFKSFWGSVELLMATTIGAGIFSLPYVFKEAGWLLGIFYMVIFAPAIIFVHRLYWLSLEKEQEKKRLLGLVEKYFGKGAFYLSFLAIFGGLIFVLTAHLTIVQQFLRIAIPGFDSQVAVIIFWLLASLPMLFNLKHIVETELPGVAIITGIIIFVVFTGDSGSFLNLPAVNFNNILLPLGAILFSLSGWTAIEPMFEWQRKNGSRKPFSALALGTFFSACLYFLFVIGILDSSSSISTDTISGLSSWPLWKLGIIGWLGILAMWISYTPVSLEIKNELEKDLRLPRLLSFAIPFLLPLLIFLSGFFNFLSIISLAGGVFLALQYVFIILVSKKILKLSGLRKFFANLLMFVFMAAAIYEIYYFAVR